MYQKCGTDAEVEFQTTVHANFGSLQIEGLSAYLIVWFIKASRLPSLYKSSSQLQQLVKPAAHLSEERVEQTALRNIVRQPAEAFPQVCG